MFCSCPFFSIFFHFFCNLFYSLYSLYSIFCIWSYSPLLYSIFFYCILICYLLFSYIPSILFSFTLSNSLVFSFALLYFFNSILFLSRIPCPVCSYHGFAFCVRCATRFLKQLLCIDKLTALLFICIPGTEHSNSLIRRAFNEKRRRTY